MSDRHRNGPIADLLCGSAFQCLAPGSLCESQDAPNSTNVLGQAVGGHPPELPDASSVKPCVDRVCGVFDEDEVVSPTALVQRIHRTEDWDEAGRQDREEDHIVVHRGHEQAIPRPKPLSKGEVESQAARREIQRLARVTASEKCLDCSYLVAHGHALPGASHESQAALVLTSFARRATTLRGSSTQSSATSAISLAKSRLKSEIPPSGSPEPVVPAVTPPKSNHVAPARFAQVMRSHMSGYPMCRRPRSLGRDEAPAK